jgi:hypothetical protein
VEAASLAQEQERADMVGSYNRLERIVVSHLQGLRKAVENEQPVNFV